MTWRFDSFRLLQAVEHRRVRDGLSKRQLARQLGLPPSALVEMSTRQRRPTLDALVALLDWLGADLFDFAERR